jgi:hypothetical protein
MLLLMVAAYLAIVVVSLWATVSSFLRPESPWGRHRVWVRLVMAVEVIYMLQAPACVYLPRAPGKPAVQRRLVGMDAAGRLYWVESTAPMAFVFGPRWWMYTRPEIVPLVPTAQGFNWVRPLRYAVWNRARWEVACSDGRRWPVPGWHARRGSRMRLSPEAVVENGTLLTLRPSDAAHPTTSEGLQGLKPGAPRWECVAPCGLPSLGLRQGLAAAPDGTIWEVFEAGDAREVHERQSRGERLLAFRIRRPEARQPPRVFTLSFNQNPGVFGATGPTGVQAGARQGLLLFLSTRTWEPEGTVYGVTEGESQARVLGRFTFNDSRPVTFSIAADGAFFTTGQAIWDTTGTKRIDLDPPLESAVWVGHTLHGVRSYPFFGDLFLERSANHSRILATAASGDFDGHDSLPTIAAGLRRSAWMFGGVDESGREDELVDLNADRSSGERQ